MFWKVLRASNLSDESNQLEVAAQDTVRAVKDCVVLS